MYVSPPLSSPQPWPQHTHAGDPGAPRRSLLVPLVITLAAVGFVAVGAVIIGRASSVRAAVTRDAAPVLPHPTTPAARPVAPTPTTVAPPQPVVPAAQMVLENMNEQPSLPLQPSAEKGMAAAGLSPLSSEVTDHFHVHLEVYLMGGAVTVPALVGIDSQTGALSPVHTHDTSGIIHVESSAREPYTLGQFFTEWGQPLGSNSIGRIHSRPGYTISWFVNGQLVSDPAAVVLQPHDVIVAFEDGANSPITPPSYTWPDGF
jgi:hypothetical protein